MGSCPLLTPPAGRGILASRINKAILKCAAIAAKNKPKKPIESALINRLHKTNRRLHKTNRRLLKTKSPLQGKTPSARQKVLNSPQ